MSIEKELQRPRSISFSKGMKCLQWGRNHLGTRDTAAKQEKSWLPWASISTEGGDKKSKQGTNKAVR